MGIKNNFNGLIRKIKPDIFKQVHISEYAYEKIAIDISLYLHKFKAISGDKWLLSITSLIMCLRRYNVHCVFIFDGKAPPEKETEREKRKNDRDKSNKQLFELEDALGAYNRDGTIHQCLIDLYDKRNKERDPVRLLSTSNKINMKWVENKIEQKKKQSFSVSSRDFELIKELLTLLNIPYYTAPGEAEKACSKLCIDKQVVAVLSDDTDLLAYKTPISLSKLNILNGSVTCVHIDELLDGLGMDRHQFTDLCIMCGTDYNSNIPRIGSNTSYAYMKQYRSIEQFEKETSIDVSVLHHTRVRTLFNHFEPIGIDNIPYCGKPDFNKLNEFMFKRNIHINVNHIKEQFENKQLVFQY